MFLNGEINLESFEDWFAQNTWNIHQSGSVAAEAVTFAIEESLAEYSSGHISESELREEFSRILEAETTVATIIESAPEEQIYFRGSAPSVLVPVRV